MKRMLERAIPIQQDSIRIHRGEAYHLQRDVVPKRATIVAYVARNAHNMNFEHYRILFVEESAVGETVQKVVETWKRSCC